MERRDRPPQSYGQLVGRQVKVLAVTGMSVAAGVHVFAYAVVLSVCAFSAEHCHYDPPTTMNEAFQPAYKMVYLMVQLTAFGSLLGFTWGNIQYLRQG